MLVSEFYPSAKRAFAGCSEADVFFNLTKAVKLLVNKGLNDALLGEMEICVCNGCTTLPRDVGTVLGVDVCGSPSLLQDQWFKYHINGPGTNYNNGVITEMGQVCTYREPSQAAYLIAEVTSAVDNNKKLRVYATDTSGNKIFTAGPDGKLYEGFLVPLIFGFAQRNPDAPALGTIYRITKEVTKDYVRLLAVNASDGASMTQIGYYEPDETLPQYRRIRVPNKSSVVVKYKKATLDIKRQTDWINIDNYEALEIACRAVKLRADDKFDAARKAEEEASRILAEETEAKRPAGPRVPQVIESLYRDTNSGLFYGS
jgi:hypothetical protein